MKTLYFLLFVIFAVNLYGQEDDYCPCEEDENNFDFLNSMMASTDDFIYIPEENDNFLIVNSSMEDDLYIPGEDKPLVESDRSKLTGPTGIYPVRSYREVMIGKKRIVILKRKRVARMKKYKGKCPVF